MAYKDTIIHSVDGVPYEIKSTYQRLDNRNVLTFEWAVNGETRGFWTPLPLTTSYDEAKTLHLSDVTKYTLEALATTQLTGGQDDN